MTQLLQNAAYGAALILIVAALRRVMGGRLIPEARLALWAVCLLRLLTPVPLESALSLWGLFVKPAPQPAQVPPLYIPAPAVTPAPRPDAPRFSWEMALGLVWLAVGLVLAGRYIWSWCRTRRDVASAILLDRTDPRYTLLPPFARLREGPMEGAPLTFGAARPTVVLPPGLEGEELGCVLAHEGVHAARRDNLWHYAMALALAVHWWNPALWLMARLLRRDIELSCDRAALKKLGADKRADYARALVSLSTQDSGPQFCQTFGRKATEERIRSIMKFKKTSLVGVIFTLALVLAVTAAFASEPREPDEESTTFSAPAMAEAATADQEGNVTRYTVDLEYLKDNLAEHVADGSMTQGLADQILELARSFSKDGKVLDWSFQGNSGLVLDKEHSICCRDEQGNLVKADPATVVSFYILPAAGNPSAGDPPTYVEEDGTIPDAVARLLGEGDIIYDGGKTGAGDYNVKLPTFDEDGNSVIYDENGDPIIIGTRHPDYVVEDGAEAAGELGSRFYTYNIVSDSSAVSGGTIRTSSGTYQLCNDKNCGVSYDHCHMDGKVVRVYQEDPGLLCAHPDCDDDKPHQHDGVQYAGKAGAYVVLQPDMEPVPSAAPTPASAPEPAQTAYPRNSKGETYGTVPRNVEKAPDLQAALGTKGELGYIRESDVPGANVKNPQEALEYEEWMKTQPETIYIPLYDSEGNVIGQFAVQNSHSQDPEPAQTAYPRNSKGETYGGY